MVLAMDRLYSLRIWILKLSIPLLLSYTLSQELDLSIAMLFLLLSLLITTISLKKSIVVAVIGSIIIYYLSGYSIVIALLFITLIYLSRTVSIETLVYSYGIHILLLSFAVHLDIFVVLIIVLGYLYILSIAYNTKECYRISFYTLLIALIIILSRLLGKAVENLTIFGGTAIAFLIGLATIEDLMKQKQKSSPEKS